MIKEQHLVLLASIEVEFNYLLTGVTFGCFCKIHE